MIPPPSQIDATTEERVRSILRTGSPSEIEAAFDQLWYWLPDGFAQEVRDAVLSVPATELAGRPRLRHLLMLADHRILREVSEDPLLVRTVHAAAAQGREHSSRLRGFSDPDDLQTAGVLAVIAARVSGDHAHALQLGAWLEVQLNALRLRAPSPSPPPPATGRPGWLTVHRGLTATLAGDLDQAVKLYTRGFAEAGPAPRAHFAGVAAAANLALIAAVRGHFDVARHWIRQTEQAGPLPESIEHLVTVGAKIARALIATEEAQPELAAHHLREVGAATQQVEVWPFIAYARSNYEAFFGDPYRGLRELEAARVVHGVLSDSAAGLVGDLLRRSEAKLLLRTTDASRVLHRAARNPEHCLPQHTALAQLLLGQHVRAVRTIARALQQSERRLSLSDAITLRLTKAVAHLRNGDEKRATASFRAAVSLRSSAAHVKPFLSVRRDDVEELSRLTGIHDVLDRLSVLRTVPPAPAMLTHLTSRELAVLQSLDQGYNAVETARRFSVSIHTVRSQIGSAYKKLRVTDRDQALARAHVLGLLAPQSSPERTTTHGTDFRVLTHSFRPGADSRLPEKS